MNLKDIVKNAPNSLIYTVGFIFVATVAAFVILAVTESDASEFRAFLNTILNIASVLLSGGALVTAGAAAKSAQRTEEQTNGELTERVKTAVQEAIQDNGGSRDG